MKKKIVFIMIMICVTITTIFGCKVSETNETNIKAEASANKISKMSRWNGRGEICVWADPDTNVQYLIACSKEHGTETGISITHALNQTESYVQTDN